MKKSTEKIVKEFRKKTTEADKPKALEEYENTLEELYHVLNNMHKRRSKNRYLTADLTYQNAIHKLRDIINLLEKEKKNVGSASI